MKIHRQNGKIFDLLMLEVYGLNYRIINGKLKVQHPVNKKYYDIRNRFGKAIVNAATANNPNDILYEKPRARRRTRFKFRRAMFEYLNRQRRRAPNFPYFEPRGDLRTRSYFVNDLLIDSSDIRALREIIGQRLAHALRTGVTRNADVSIQLVFNDNNMITSKCFNSFLIKNQNDFWRLYQQWLDMTTANNENYTYTITNIKIRIVKENAGGCEKRKKIKKFGNSCHKAPKASNNNCFFLCDSVWNNLDLGDIKRLGRKKGNEIREEFGLEEDALIPLSSALDIFSKYRKDENIIIKITDNDTLETYYSTPSRKNDPSKTIVAHLCLDKSHYSEVELRVIKQKTKCNQCGREYIKQHKCNPNRVQFYNTKLKKNGKRFLICGNHTEPYNNKDEVVHYDLESFKNRNKDENGQATDKHIFHSPYIVGFTDPNAPDGFNTFEGKNCISEFVDYLIKRANKWGLNHPRYIANLEKANQLDEDKSELMKKPAKDRTADEIDKISKLTAKISQLCKIPTLYVNAYNGANFDHYFLFQEFLKKGLKPQKQVINNGSIISFEYINIKLFDVCKHLQGSLKENLEGLKCDVQKGDFNHDDPRILNGWEGMPEELKVDCLKYLKSDVLGLKELYDKLNTTVYNQDKVNVTSYISTSSLTFNMWKKNIRNKFVIELPTLEQEIAFRNSVRGGRTYKSKHRFISEQYEGFKKGEIGFDDVKDYCIDADVVSLYPTAMAKYPYPVGECKQLSKDEARKNPNSTISSYGKMGIYKIK